MSGRLKWTLAGIAFLAMAWWGLGNLPKPPRLTFISVGQGDAILYQDSGIAILVDVGPKTREGYDAGERIVLPKLRRMGVRRLDLIFLTHPDSDHVGGIAAVASRYPEARIVVSAAFRNDSNMNWWLDQAKVADGRVEWVSTKSRFQFANSSLEVAPPPMTPASSDNDGSLFLRIQCGQASALLTGDASISVEESMIKNLRWRAQVLKAGHHGSRTSSSPAFVREVNPTWAVVSCGRDNAFGHPHRSVLDVFKLASVEVLRTDLQGDVVFEARESGFIPLLKSHSER